MTDHPLSRSRLQLLRNGYRILPGLDKTCRVKGWNSSFLADEAARWGSDEAAVVAWDEAYASHHTTNMLITDRVVAIDCDVNDPELAALLADIIRDVARDVIETAPARYGSGEYKCALFCRLAEGEEPFIRHGSRKYARADETERWVKGNGDKPEYHHVEVFGGAPTSGGKVSRQFGIMGPHTRAKGGRPAVMYEWADGPTLLDTPRDQLPEITVAQVWQIIERFEQAAAAAGGFEALPDGEDAGGGWVYDIDRTLSRFATLHDGVVNYSGLEALVDEHGEVRCVFAGMVTDRPDRCTASWSDKHACVMITDWKTDAWHLPADLKPAEVDLKEFAAVFEQLRERTEKGETAFEPPAISVSDFYAYMTEHRYLHIPTRALWPAASVNARLGKIHGVKAALWLDQNRYIEQITWAPGESEIVRDMVMTEGGWTEQAGMRVFNLYRAPQRDFVAGDISVWRNHLERIYPGEADEIERWMAQHAQRPADKVNHCLVMGGRQGIGKDTVLEPLRHAVGAWNFNEVNPIQMMGRFNGFLKAVCVRVSEVRDRGEVDRYAFYNHTKIMMSAPPDTIMVDEKNMKEHRIPNVVGVILTLNEKSSLYLPADDRRHFVAWSEASAADFDAEYFNRIYRWYASGGLDAVAAHLRSLDLAGFDAKRPPRKTVAFHDIVALSRVPEDAEMDEMLDRLGRPDAVTLEEVRDKAKETPGGYEFAQYLSGSANARKAGHRFEECGYASVHNPQTKLGLWQVKGKQRNVYARCDLGSAGMLAAARAKAETATVTELKPK